MCKDPELKDESTTLNENTKEDESLDSILSETESDGLYEDEEDEVFDVNF